MRPRSGRGLRDCSRHFLNTERRLSGDDRHGVNPAGEICSDTVMAHPLHNLGGAQSTCRRRWAWAGRKADSVRFRRRESMYYNIAVILLILWLLGLVSAYAIGAFIHVLLVLAIVLLLAEFLRGRRVV